MGPLGDGILQGLVGSRLRSVTFGPRARGSQGRPLRRSRDWRQRVTARLALRGACWLQSGEWIGGPFREARAATRRRPSLRRVEEVETKGRWEGRAGGRCGEPWRPRDVCEDGAATCLGEALGVRLDVSRGPMPGFQWSLQMRYVSTHLPALSSGHTPAHGSDMSPPACSPALRRLRPPPVHSTPDWFLQTLQGVSLLRSASLTPSPLPAPLPRHRHRNRPFLGPSTCRELRTPPGRGPCLLHSFISSP